MLVREEPEEAEHSSPDNSCASSVASLAAISVASLAPTAACAASPKTDAAAFVVATQEDQLPVAVGSFEIGGISYDIQGTDEKLDVRDVICIYLIVIVVLDLPVDGLSKDSDNAVLLREVRGLRADVQSARNESKANFDVLFGMLRQFMLKSDSSAATTIAKNPTIVLPTLPLRQFDELVLLNGRLQDAAFLDQMVIKL